MIRLVQCNQSSLTTFTQQGRACSLNNWQSVKCRKQSFLQTITMGCSAVTFLICVGRKDCLARQEWIQSIFKIDYIIVIFILQQMGLWEKLARLIPRPFKFLQRKLDIQAEWADFKENMRPHRYKARIVLLAVTFPLYAPYLRSGLEQAKHKLGQFIHKQSQPTEPAFQWVENVLKHLLEHIFTDETVKDEAMDFLHNILKDENFVGEILQLLVSALKSEVFMGELKAAVKQILIDELKDPEVQTSINQFLESLARNKKIRDAFIELIQEVFSSQQSVDTIVSLLKKGITNDEVKGVLGESVNFAVREVLADEETLNQLKIFVFFLLRKFQNDDEIKGMMDILFAKGLGLVKKKKDTQLQKLLRPQKKVDLL